MTSRTRTNTENVEFGELGTSLGFLLRLAQLQSFRGFYDDMAEGGIRPGEFSVLMLVGENPGLRQGVLARALMIKRAHMTKMVQAMVAEGLLLRSVPVDDKRSVELRLSEEGARRLAELRGDFVNHEARNTLKLQEEELAVLKHLLQKYLGYVTEP